MSDPLSAVSGAAGLVSLGITACQGLVKYIHSFAGANETVKSTIGNADALAQLLEQINLYLQHPSLDTMTQQSIQRCVLNCEDGVKALSAKASKLMDQSTGANASKMFAQKLIYPFREHTLKKLRLLCEELKGDLQLGLSTLNIDIGHVSLKRFDGLAASIHDVQNTVSGAERILQGLGKTQADELFAKVSAWLSPQWHGKSERKQRETCGLVGRQDGFARSVKASDAFQSWCQSPGNVLWCHGMPGTGKTVLVSHLIHHLSTAMTTDDCGVAYLYCSYKDWEEHKAVALLGHINQQLLGTRRSSFGKVHDMYQTHTKVGSRPLLSDQIALLRTLSEGYRTIVVVDALDELTTVDDCRQTVISELCGLCPSISLLVTSRPLPGLADALSVATKIEVTTSEADMRGYLEYCLPRSETMRNHMTDDPTLIDEICTAVIGKARGMFLMARLYLKTLMDIMTRKKVKIALRKLPIGLDEVYDQTIQRIQAQGEERAQTAMLALSWIALCPRPLSLTDVQTALAVEPDEKELDLENITHKSSLLTACAGIIVYNEETDILSLVHYTLQEYFDKKADSVFRDAHTSIARTCLTVMLFEEYSGVDMPSVQSSIESLLKQPLLAYAIDHWGWHQRLSQSATNMPLVLQLLQDKARVAVACCLMSAERKISVEGRGRHRRNVSGLSLAAYFGLTNAVDCLVARGMSTEAKDSLGWSALHWAAAGGAASTVMALIRHGSHINIKDDLGWTPLHRATESQDTQVAGLLISEGADVNCVDCYGGTPLYRAAQFGATAIVELLLENRAKTETTNQYLQTALHRAAAGGYLEVVKVLLAKGANPAPKDHWGYTPRLLAMDAQHDEITKLLPLPYRIKERK